MNLLQQLINEHLKRKRIFTEKPAWVIKSSPLGGRGVFATRDIAPGEVIFKDAPLLIGPRIVQDRLICVKCFKETNTGCSRNCKLPLCSQKCQNSRIHKRECRKLRAWKCYEENHEPDLELLKSLTALRVFALNKTEMKLLGFLETHQKTKRSQEVASLERKFRISDSEAAQLETVCAVLDTNAFEVPASSEAQLSLRGVYPLSSYMNHSCIPNTTHLFDSNQTMTVKSTVFIQAGQEILHCYTKFLWGTCVRQPFLTRTKSFSCKCKRCGDPSEFGTNLSALFCLKCRGITLPIFVKKLKIIVWKCTSCEEYITADKAGIIMNMLGNRLDEFEACESARDVLVFLSEVFVKYAPFSNQIAVQLRLKLIWTLGHKERYLWGDLSDELLDEKQTICRDFLQLLKTLGAGRSKMRGLLLYELYCCLKERLRRIQLRDCDENQENIDKNQFLDMENLFNEAKEILEDDVHSPPEIRQYYKNQTVINSSTISDS